MWRLVVGVAGVGGERRDDGFICSADGVLKYY